MQKMIVTNNHKLTSDFHAKFISFNIYFIKKYQSFRLNNVSLVPGMLIVSTEEPK